MMNVARFGVGMEGVSVSERAYQRARDYAHERIQGTDIGVRGGPRVPIIAHPDVRRMLMTMRAQAEATRALAYVVASAHDAATCHPDADQRKRNQAFVDLMIPVVKGWSTEIGIEVASLGIQVHGGAGVSDDFPLAAAYASARTLRFADGPDEVHRNQIGKMELARYLK